jgi:hypothetical protein
MATGSAHLVRDREVSSLLQEQRGDLRSTMGTCLHQGRVSTLPRERDPSEERRQGEERRDLVLMIQSSTILDQEGDDIMMAPSTCPHQSCPSILPREKERDPSEEMVEERGERK